MEGDHEPNRNKQGKRQELEAGENTRAMKRGNKGEGGEKGKVGQGQAQEFLNFIMQLGEGQETVGRSGETVVVSNEVCAQDYGLIDTQMGVRALGDLES